MRLAPDDKGKGRFISVSSARLPWLAGPRPADSMEGPGTRLRPRQAPGARSRSSQAAFRCRDPSGTKKAPGSIGKRRRTSRFGLSWPAILNACSIEGAMICTRRVTALSRTSTATRIIPVFPFLRPCSTSDAAIPCLGIYRRPGGAASPERLSIGWRTIHRSGLRAPLVCRGFRSHRVVSLCRERTDPALQS